MSAWILETGRLCLRELAEEDFGALCKILQDAGAMYAYEHAFSDDEVRDWLHRQLESYRQNGFGLWAVAPRQTGALIGQCGLTLQACGEETVLEIGYLFRRDCWHNGYATEAAKACKAYAFEKLGAEEVYSIVRDTNAASRKVALRNGMALRGKIMKYYHGMDMPHDVFSVRRGR